MHYRNGREARENDKVIAPTWKDENGKPKNVVAGTLHSLNAACTSCNGQIAYPVPGGTNQACVTIGDCWHAEDAFIAAEATLPKVEEDKPAA